MTAPVDNGGPAFPVEVDMTQPFGRQTGNTSWQTYGMSLRDYYIAHAPAEPQPWFQPVMPHPRPAYPAQPKFTSEQRDEITAHREYGKPIEKLSEPVAAWVRAVEHFRALSRDWDTAREKQWYVQWPAAWADEMLKARKP